MYNDKTSYTLIYSLNSSVMAQRQSVILDQNVPKIAVEKFLQKHSLLQR